MKLMDGDIRDIAQTRTFRGILIGIAIMVVALVIFQIGVFVGETKATFSYGLGDNYYRTFEGRGFGSDTPSMTSHGAMPGAFGATGRIVEINLPNLVIASSDNVEKTVVIGDDTIVRRSKDTLTASDIAVGDYVVIIGEPDNAGDIDAKLIRIVPPPQADATTTREAMPLPAPAVPEQGPAH